MSQLRSPLSPALLESSHRPGRFVLQAFLRPGSTLKTGDEKDGFDALTFSIIEKILYAGSVQNMDALFIELPAFQKHRDDYLDDDLFRSFQLELLKTLRRAISLKVRAGCEKSAFSINVAVKASVAGLG